MACGVPLFVGTVVRNIRAWAASSTSPSMAVVIFIVDSDIDICDREERRENSDVFDGVRSTAGARRFAITCIQREL